MISVVVPVLDEERALPRTLHALLAQDGQFEVIVVDGGSSDRTPEILREVAARDPRVRVIDAPRGRAPQLNAGARASRGDWLLFLHADTILPEGALPAVASQPAAVRAGCFHHRFSGPGTMLRVLSWLHNRRFLVTRIAYGDQALFIRRELFDRLGGFPERPMEDIAFGLVLRQATRPVLLPAAVTTDSRKFEQMGRWRALTRAVALLVRFRLGSDVTSDPFFQDYR